MPRGAIGEKIPCQPKLDKLIVYATLCRGDHISAHLCYELSQPYAAILTEYECT